MAAAGTGRFYAITVFYGNNAVHYTSEKLLEGVERVWLRYYTEVNPAILFSIIPYRSLCWFLAHSERTASSTLDPGMIVLCWSFYHPWSGQVNQGARACHFVTKTHTGFAVDGSPLTRDAILDFLSGLAHTYSVLWDEQYGAMFRELAEHASSRQIGLFLDPVYFEAKILDCFAYFTDYFSNPNVLFHPAGTPKGTQLRGRDLTVPEGIHAMHRHL